MRKLIITKRQLNEYINKKKQEKVFSEIVELMHVNTKQLSENVSYEKINQSIIDNYKRKNLISSNVFEMLVSYKIINENYEIL